MARFEDVLAWLNQPKNEKIWIVLDIKVSDYLFSTLKPFKGKLTRRHRLMTQLLFF
jgi:hypothetical protein